ncbi:MAG: hypothetical protein J2O48_00010 [Solirubrobacterales bacterium]|nr:hypothetical protein [Solirubrobacterales bacterium]
MNVVAANRLQVPISGLDVQAYTIPTDGPEADGTLAWDSTTIVVVHAYAQTGHTEELAGIGYTYTDAVAADLIESTLMPVVIGMDALAPQRAAVAMDRVVRNLGRPGVASMAISAVDLALWDLKARLLDMPLYAVLGAVRDQLAIYGSGGFTSYTNTELAAQLAGWAAQGIGAVKMKVGSDPAADRDRVAIAREAIGPNVELMVDANGAYNVKQALALTERFVEDAQICWLEEPVSSEDTGGMAFVRNHVPAGVDVAAGEYGFDLGHFHGLLDAGAVDVLQADVTRCGGITGLLRLAGVCAAHQIDLSLHCAPGAHLHPGLGLERFKHLEYFHDHVRLERMLFDGVVEPTGGFLAPDPARPGNGLALRREEADPYAV